MTAKDELLKALKEENKQLKDENKHLKGNSPADAKSPKEEAKIETPCDCEDAATTELPQKNTDDKSAAGQNTKTEKRTSNDSGALAGPNTKPTVRPVVDPQEAKKEKED